MALQQLADGLWEATTTIKVPGGIHLPCRSTILRDRDAGLVIYSPLDFDEETAASIDALGEVHTLVGPNLFHHLYLRPAKERWPDATLLGAEGLAAKRENVAFDGVTEDGFVAPGVEAVVMRGMPKINEVVLVHAPSRTVVCADFTFRLRNASGFAKLVFKMLGDYGETLQIGRVWRFNVKDRAAYMESVERLLSKDFDGVVMAHGDPVLEGARAQLEAALG